MSTNGWMVKNDMMHIHNGLLITHEKVDILSFVTIYGPWAHYAKQDTSDRET